jgi:hypothetical protein
MPTPFTHLEMTQRLLADAALPPETRDMLHADVGPFMLGNIAADARVGSGAPRETTHFYAYGEMGEDAPWRVMIRQNPGLLHPHDAAHRAFIAGYVTHLAADEYWSRHMVGPHFVAREWADRGFRFYMLHIIMIHMDLRDRDKLDDWQPVALCAAHPENWLAFASDDDLCAWQRLIYDQIKPGGASQTYAIMAERLGKEPDELRAFVESPEQMESGLWRHIPQYLLREVETGMYAYARDQLALYLNEAE